MTTITQQELVQIIEQKAVGTQRILVAIAGGPGSGKSTVAEQISACLSPKSAVLPMDGFHYDNNHLDRLGLRARKGAPDTFDAAGFAELLKSVQTSPAVSFPTFDRENDAVVLNGGTIEPDTQIVLVEGNYLLLRSGSWSELAGLFEVTVGLSVEPDVLQQRLIQRWIDHGLPPAEAEVRAIENDMANAAFVLQNSHSPDYEIHNQD